MFKVTTDAIPEGPGLPVLWSEKYHKQNTGRAVLLTWTSRFVARGQGEIQRKNPDIKADRSPPQQQQ